MSHCDCNLNRLLTRGFCTQPAPAIGHCCVNANLLVHFLRPSAHAQFHSTRSCVQSFWRIWVIIVVPCIGSDMMGLLSGVHQNLSLAQSDISAGTRTEGRAILLTELRDRAIAGLDSEFPGVREGGSETPDFRDTGAHFHAARCLACDGSQGIMVRGLVFASSVRRGSGFLSRMLFTASLLSNRQDSVVSGPLSAAQLAAIWRGICLVPVRPGSHGPGFRTGGRHGEESTTVDGLLRLIRFFLQQFHRHS